MREKNYGVAISNILNLMGSYIEVASGFLSVLLLIAMTIVALAGVFFRYVLESPFVWTEEVSRFLMLLIVFLSINVAFRRNEHIAVNYLVLRMPPIAAKVLDYIGHGLIAVFLYYLIRQGYSMTTGTIMTASTIDLSMRWLYMFLPLGAMLTLLQLIFRITDKLLKDVNHYWDWWHGHGICCCS